MVLPNTLNIRGIVFAIAIIVGFYITSRTAESKGLNSAKVHYISFFTILGALLGARIYYELFHHGYHGFSSYFTLSFWRGGTGSSGVWIGALVAVYVATLVSKVNLWKYLDSSTVAVAFAIFIGRMGCFFKGCCFGTPTNLPWAVSYPPDSHAFRTQIEHLFIDQTAEFTLPVHPVQLYEASYSLLLLIITVIFFRRYRFDGQAFLLLAILYSIGRFFFEFIRGDNRPFLFGVSVPQWIYLSILLLALSSYLLVKFKKGDVK